MLGALLRAAVTWSVKALAPPRPKEPRGSL